MRDRPSSVVTTIGLAQRCSRTCSRRPGPFPFTDDTSKDAAIFAPLAPGAGGYAVRVIGSPGAVGRVIAELYDSTAITAFSPSTPRLINVSLRKKIDQGATLNAGFVIAGSKAKTVLVRAIGPGLGAFGLPGVMPNPRLALFNSSSVSIATKDGWGGDPQLTAAGARFGAFKIDDFKSADSMLLHALSPGNYSAEVRGVGPPAVLRS